MRRLALILTLSGCAAFTPAQSIDDARQQLERVRQGTDAAAVLLSVAEARCKALAPIPREHPCLALPETKAQLERVRAALQNAEAGLGTLEDAANALAPLIESTRAVLE